MKIVEKSGFLQKSEQKCENSLTNFCEYFELGAVRRSVYLVDREKRLLKMSIGLQRSASIQKRTSPLKFDHFRWKIHNFLASNLSTKVLRASAAAAGTHEAYIISAPDTRFREPTLPLLESQLGLAGRPALAAPMAGNASPLDASKARERLGFRLSWKIRCSKIRFGMAKWSNFGGLVLSCIEADFCVQMANTHIAAFFRDLQILIAPLHRS